MLTPRGNHSRLPAPGALVRVVGLAAQGFAPRDRWRVESYPLTDSPDPRYAIGIHTVRLRRLADGREAQVSGFYCEELP
ncbi:MAG: hypothetical protein ACRDH2_14245 [Anaerolineales bacterium]